MRGGRNRCRRRALLDELDPSWRREKKGMDKGNVASGRDRDVFAWRARIAAGRRVESPAVGRGMGVGDTVEHRR